MWTDIVTAGAILAFLALILRFLNGKIDKVGSCKMDTKLCDERSDNIIADLAKGDAKFAAIIKTQGEQKEILGRYDERLKAIQEAVVK